MVVVKNMSKKNKINYQTEEQPEIKSFIIILIIVVVFIGIVYFLNKVFIDQDKSIYDITYQTGTVNDDKVIAGNLFNRAEKEYFVLAYDPEDLNAAYYSALATKYKEKQTDAIRIYYLDTASALNKDYVTTGDEVSNPAAKNLNSLKMKGLTFIQIKGNEIVRYLENIEAIEKALEVTNPKTT